MMVLPRLQHKTQQVRLNGADDFDGNDDVVDCGNDASLNITDNLTMESWIRMEGDSSDNFHGIIGKKFAYALMIQDSND